MNANSIVVSVAMVVATAEAPADMTPLRSVRNTFLAALTYELSKQA